MLCKAGSDSTDRDTCTVKSHHSDLEACAFLADECVCGKLDIVEAQLAGCAAAHAHLVLELADGQTLCVLRDNENADALCACFGIGLSHDQIVVGNT